MTNIFISQPMRGKTSEEIVKRKEEIINYLQLNDEPIIVNDFSIYFRPEYTGKKLEKGDTLAMSLLSIKKAKIVVFDTDYDHDGSYFGCDTELSFFIEYLYDSDKYDKCHLDKDAKIVCYIRKGL